MLLSVALISNASLSYCGNFRDPGKLLTSMSVWTSNEASILKKTSMECVECPIVHIFFSFILNLFSRTCLQSLHQPFLSRVPLFSELQLRNTVRLFPARLP